MSESVAYGSRGLCGSSPFGIQNGSRNNAVVRFADAAARNEEVFRSINERIEEDAKQHGVEQLLPFHCECATEACLDTIELAPAEYDRIASHRARFVVVPGHEQASVETVVEAHPGYLVVEKTGEARAELNANTRGHAIRSDRGHHVRSR
jgi:hypothetical protein